MISKKKDSDCFPQKKDKKSILWLFRRRALLAMELLKMENIDEKAIREFVESVVDQKKPEDFQFDLKQEWPKTTGSLLKDIICFANSMETELSYLIYGVTDDYQLIGITDEMTVDRRKQWIVNILDSAPFSGDVRPLVKLVSFLIHEKRVDVLVIESNSRNIPYFLSEKYPKTETVGIGIYCRKNGSNSSVNRNEDRPLIEKMWKHHFRLDDAKPIDIFIKNLLLVNQWKDGDAGQGFDEVYYFENDPRYSINIEIKSNQYLDYCRCPWQQIQTNPKGGFGDFKMTFSGTQLCHYRLDWLDSGRLCIPQPTVEYLHHWSKDQYYPFAFYLRDSVESTVLWFNYYRDWNSEKECALRLASKIICVFENESEVKEFSNYLECNFVDLNNRVEEKSKQMLPDYDIYREGNLETQRIYKDMVIEKAIKELHDSWREECLGKQRLSLLDLIKN